MQIGKREFIVHDSIIGNDNGRMSVRAGKPMEVEAEVVKPSLTRSPPMDFISKSE